MKMTVDMPKVTKCSVRKCAYNVEGGCHAKAITIGDGTTPHCDTSFSCGSHCHSKMTAGVGACKVSGCAFNSDFECQAESIAVGTALRATFVKRGEQEDSGTFLAFEPLD